MKKFLFIIGLIMGWLLFNSSENTNSDKNLLAQAGAVMQTESSSNTQHHLEILRNDLKDCCGITTRNIQTTNYSYNLRTQKNITKTLQAVRIKGHDALLKISEDVLSNQSVNFSTLLCRTGHFVYALRKLLI